MSATPSRPAIVTARLSLSRTAAARALGVSVDHFDRHIAPDLRVVRSGRLVLIPVREIEKWLDEHAAYPLA
jgi:hypothetical protein